MQIQSPVFAHRGGVSSVVLAPLPDGRVVCVSGGRDGTARVWLTPARTDRPEREADMPTEIATLPGHVGKVVVATSTLDGDRVGAVTADDAGTIRLWTLPDGKLIRTVTGPGGSSDGLAAGAGVVVAIGLDGGLRRVDLRTGEETYQGPDSHPAAMVSGTRTAAGNGAVAVSQDRSVVVSGHAASVLLWDLWAGGPAGGRRSRDSKVHAVAAGAGPSGSLVVAGLDSHLRFWDLDSGSTVGTSLYGPRASVDAVAVTDVDGDPVAVGGSRDGTVSMWTLIGEDELGAFSDEEIATVEDVAVARRDADSPEALTVLLACEGYEVRVRELSTGRPLGDLDGPDSPTTCVAVATRPGEGAVVLSGCWAGELHAWDLDRHARFGVPIRAHRAPVVAVRSLVRRDGRIQAVTAGKWDGELGVWELSPEPCRLLRLTGHSGAIDGMAVTELPDGEAVVVACGQGGIWRWEATAVGADRPIRLRNAAVERSGGVRAVALARLGGVGAVVISGDAEGLVHVNRLDSGAPIGGPWRVSGGPVRAIALVPVAAGEPILATAGIEAETRFWHPASGTEAVAALPTAGRTRALAGAEGRRVILGGTGLAVAHLRSWTDGADRD